MIAVRRSMPEQNRNSPLRLNVGRAIECRSATRRRNNEQPHMPQREINLCRGLVAAFISVMAGFTLPWFLVCLLLVADWFGNHSADWEPLFKRSFTIDGAWLASYLFMSLCGTVAFLSFGIGSTRNIRGNLFAVGIIGVGVPYLWQIIHGPRMKSEPRFGETQFDILLLTVPSVTTGVFIIAWRILKRKLTTAA